MFYPRILDKHWCIYSCLQIPPRENWLQYVRRVYATAINFPCISTLTGSTVYNVLYTGVYSKYSILYNTVYSIEIVCWIMYSILEVNAQYSICIQIVYCIMYSILEVNAQYSILYTDCILYNVFYIGGERSIQYTVYRLYTV